MVLLLHFAWVSEMRYVVSISRISCHKLTCDFSLFFFFFSYEISVFVVVILDNNTAQGGPAVVCFVPLGL